MKRTKKLLSLVLAGVMSLGLVAPAFAAENTTIAPNPTAKPVENEKIVLLHTNDVHGGIAGYGKVAALRDQYEAEGAYVLLLDAGDFAQGDPTVNTTQGATAIELMNAVGYDAVALGNHEFDFGYPNCKKLAEDANFPVLGANIYYDGKLAFEDNVTFTSPAGTKIGVFGLDTPETATKAHPAKIAGVTFLGTKDAKDMFDCAQQQVDELKAEGCDLVVCVAHLGTDSESMGHRSIDLLDNVNGIDVLIDGHSHSTLEEVKEATNGTGVVNGTYLTSTGTKLENIGKVVLENGKVTEVSEINTKELDIAPNAEVQALADSIQKKIDDEYGVVFAKTNFDLNGVKKNVRTHETNMADLITDAMMWGCEQNDVHVDAAITNGGGIRAAIPAGDITKKDINTVLPFGNELSIVKITGAELLETLEVATAFVPEALGGFPQVSGIQFTVDATKAYDAGDNYPGSTYHKPNSINRVTIQTVAGKPFDMNATYAIATNDFMAGGGDVYYVMKAATSNTNLGIPLDQVVMDYITDTMGGVVSDKYADPDGEGRITIIKDVLADYTDVNADAWYAPAARYVLTNGYMQGTGAGVFAPDATVTRGTVYQTLYNMAGKPDVTEAATFTDVDGMWYANAAAWAEDMGLTSGTGNGMFSGDKAVTRQELAKIFADYAADHNIVPAERADLSAFVDADTVAPWAKESMNNAVALGILKGKNGNALAPVGTAVRTELAQILMNYDALEPNYEETVVSIEVPAQNGIPAHTIPGTLTLPVDAEKAPAVVMLHGTGSNRDEAGGGYAMAAPVMAARGIATLRIDFMGNGDSTASYTDYCYTSANQDAKAAADYLAKLDGVDGTKIGVMGWSQGGTNALTAAEAYPETFQAVVTWSGALEIGDMFEDFDAAKATAEKDGFVEMTFDWREPLHAGARWFQEVAATDMLKVVADIKAPILAINGKKDDVVPMANAQKIVELAQNAESELYLVDECDHTYNVFSGDYRAIYETIDATADYFLSTLA